MGNPLKITSKYESHADEYKTQWDIRYRLSLDEWWFGMGMVYALM